MDCGVVVPVNFNFKPANLSLVILNDLELGLGIALAQHEPAHAHELQMVVSDV